MKLRILLVALVVVFDLLCAGVIIATGTTWLSSL